MTLAVAATFGLVALMPGSLGGWRWVILADAGKRVQSLEQRHAALESAGLGPIDAQSFHSLQQAREALELAPWPTLVWGVLALLAAAMAFRFSRRRWGRACFRGHAGWMTWLSQFMPVALVLNGLGSGLGLGLTLVWSVRQGAGVEEVLGGGLGLPVAPLAWGMTLVALGLVAGTIFPWPQPQIWESDGNEFEAAHVGADGAAISADEVALGTLIRPTSALVLALMLGWLVPEEAGLAGKGVVALGVMLLVPVLAHLPVVTLVVFSLGMRHLGWGIEGAGRLQEVLMVVLVGTVVADGMLALRISRWIARRMRPALPVYSESHSVGPRPNA